MTAKLWVLLMFFAISIIDFGATANKKSNKGRAIPGVRSNIFKIRISWSKCKIFGRKMLGN